MSSRRKIQARRRGQRQAAVARTRGLIHVRVPEIQERTTSPFPTYAFEVARDGSEFAFIGVPMREPGNRTAELVALALRRPNLSVNGLREAVEAAREVDATLTKLQLSTWDIARLCMSLGIMPIYTDYMEMALSRALGITLREHWGIPEGAAVLGYADGRTVYLAPHTSKEKA